MGLLSKFEGKMEDTVEGAADRMGAAPLSPVQIAKKAEKQMRREKMVGAGKQYAPTLYTVLVNADDDRRLLGYYPTLAGETETYLSAKAAEQGLVMDGQPLVRFIVDDGLKHGKFDVIAEPVAAPIIAQLRAEEMQRYGIGGGQALGVTMFGERVADVFHPGDHGTTFGGNPVCCAGAVNILSRIDDRLLEGVRERSDYLRRTLQAAPGIRSVTGMGLMLGLEIDIPAREFAERALREGVLVTTAKQKIRLLPALNIPMELLKTAAQALVHCAAE